jgi:basic membrane protein A
MRRWSRIPAGIAALALVAAACGGGQEEAAPTGGGGLPGEGMKACQVTDVGGIDDKSFNATAWAGVQRAQEELGVEGTFLESQTQDDYAPNIQAFIDQGCDIIITVGFLLGDATKEAANANPDQPFAIVDFAYGEGEIENNNVLGLTFATDQAAFLAGYLAAGMTKSGKVATYGGINIPPVSIFMNGFWAGVQRYNQDNGTDVEVLGWDAAAQEGTFTGDFEDQTKGRQVTEEFLAEGADIILPVAGPVGFGTTAALQDSPEDDWAVWVDTDGCVSASEFCPLFLTSVMKNMDVAVFEAIKQVVEGTFEGGVYVGTLDNDGVGIAPYHEFEDDVPQELKDAVEELRQGIIDGSISADYNDYL